MALLVSLLVGFALAAAAGPALIRLRLPARPSPGEPGTARRSGPIARWLARRRGDRLRDQLPEGLGALATSVRAGLSLPQALATAGGTVAEPLGGEFRRIVEEVRLGGTLDRALDGLEARVPLPDVTLLVAGLKLARSTGGGLAPLLDRVAESVRERARLRGHVRALTAQGRLSGWVVGSMPVVLLVLMAFIDPAFIRPLVATPAGWLILAAAAVLEGFGALTIRAVIRVEP